MSARTSNLILLAALVVIAIVTAIAVLIAVTDDDEDTEASPPQGLVPATVPAEIPVSVAESSDWTSYQLSWPELQDFAAELTGIEPVLPPYLPPADGMELVSAAILPAFVPPDGYEHPGAYNANAGHGAVHFTYRDPRIQLQPGVIDDSYSVIGVGVSNAPYGLYEGARQVPIEGTSVSAMVVEDEISEQWAFEYDGVHHAFSINWPGWIPDDTVVGMIRAYLDAWDDL